MFSDEGPASGADAVKSSPPPPHAVRTAAVARHERFANFAIERFIKFSLCLVSTSQAIAKAPRRLAKACSMLGARGVKARTIERRARRSENLSVFSLWIRAARLARALARGGRLGLHRARIARGPRPASP